MIKINFYLRTLTIPLIPWLNAVLRILATFCVCLSILPAECLAKTELRRWDVTSLEGWHVEGDVRIKAGRVELKAPRGKIEKQISVNISDRDAFLSIQAEIKFDGIRLGERRYRAPNITIEVNGKTAHWIRYEGDNWHIATFTARVSSKQRSQLTIGIKNSAKSGILLVKKIQLWSTNKEEINSFDYPVTWASQFKSSPIQIPLKHSNRGFLPLNKKLFGFNSRYYTTDIDVSHLLNHKKTKDVKPFVARFPGGTISNFYQWDCDCLPLENLSNFPMYQKRRWYQNLFNILSKPGSLGQNAVASWANQNDIHLSLVLNPLMGLSGRALAEGVLGIGKKGCQYDLVEIGNELYNPPQRGKQMPTTGHYIRYVKMITPDLRKYLPQGTRMGLPFSTDDWGWNKSLANAGLDYDGIILHLYAPGSSVTSIEQDRYLLNYPQKTVPGLLKKFRRLCPGKHFWITEWGILDRPLYKINNSQIGTLFSANMFLTLMREKDVEAAFFHALFDTNFGLFKFLQDAEMNMFDDETKISRQYPFWKMMRTIFVDYPETCQVVVDSENSSVKEPDVNMQLFRNDRQQVLLIVNNSCQPYEINFKYLNFKPQSKTIGFTHPDLITENLHSVNIVPPLSIVLFEEGNVQRQAN